MAFYQLIKRLTIDIFLLFALIMSLLFLYTQIIPFYTSARALGYINGQSISYMTFSILYLLLPFCLIWNSPRFNKRKCLKIICYAISAAILIGTICDLISFGGFRDYAFTEGDMIFINILWNMPNIWGALFSIIISVMYFLLGKKIVRKRREPYGIYLAIFILSVFVPFIYTYFTTGMLPRETFLHKALFIIPEQLFILVSLSISASSRSLWCEHVWN
ncbi:MAG: hypothetical protein J6C82_02615 [Clostridia bacterium]|nr:hypothetical protein [Clostridia bacterium]